MKVFHIVTPEFPPLLGGVSEHSRVLAAAAAARGREVHVWTTPGALSAGGVQVHTMLGAFTPADLSRTNAALERYDAPRDLLVQWVPHGFGYRGLNVHFARWVARRAAKGDRVDVMVHEPFVDYFGGSWIQPARALVQRHMTQDGAPCGASRVDVHSRMGGQAPADGPRRLRAASAAGARNHPRR